MVGMSEVTFRRFANALWFCAAPPSIARRMPAPSTAAVAIKGVCMKAWQLDRLGGELRFNDVRTPEPRPGSALVRIEASALMSYLKAYVEGTIADLQSASRPVHDRNQRNWRDRGGWARRLASEAGPARGAVIAFRRVRECRGSGAGPDRADVESGRRAGLERLAGRNAGRVRADAGGGDHAGGRTGPVRFHGVGRDRSMHQSRSAA